MENDATLDKMRDAYFKAGQEAGCPPDQMLNFWTARIFLQPKQLKFAAAARLADAPDGPSEIALGGARGTGKSFVLLAQAVADDCRRYSGLKVLILRKQLKAAKEQFDDIKKVVMKHIPHTFDGRANILTLLENGSRIVLGHYAKESDIDKHLGIEYDVVCIEESTSLSDKAKKNIKASTRTSKVGWRPRTYHATNPGGIDHKGFVKKFVTPFKLNNETDTRFIHAFIEDNVAINKDYINTLDQLTGWQKQAWRYASFDIDSGLYYTTFDENTHVIDPFEIPSDWKFWGGFDYGFTHKTSFHLFAKGGDGISYCIAEHAESKKLVEYHANEIKLICNRYAGGIQNLSGIFAGGDVFFNRGTVKTVAQEYSDQGITLSRANMDRIVGCTSLLRGLGDPQSGNPPLLYIFKNCVGAISALQRMEHDPSKPEAVLKVDMDEEENEGDDCFDSLRYGYTQESNIVTFKKRSNHRLAKKRFK